MAYADGDTLINIENVTGSAFDDVIEGSTTNNVLIGGDGNDTLSYGRSILSVNISLAVTGAQSTGGAGSDTVSGFENLLGGSGNDTLTGSSIGNQIDGGAGNDIITGGGDIDALDGQEGSDVYIIASTADHQNAEINDTGNAGTDELRYTGTAATTFVVFAGDTGLEKITIGTGTGANAVVTGTTAINIDATALNYGVAIIGNGGANVLQSGLGWDSLDGGAASRPVLVGGWNGRRPRRR